MKLIAVPHVGGPCVPQLTLRLIVIVFGFRLADLRPSKPLTLIFPLPSETTVAGAEDDSGDNNAPAYGLLMTNELIVELFSGVTLWNVTAIVPGVVDCTTIV